MGIELVVFDIAGITLLNHDAEQTFRALKRAGLRIALDSECSRAIVDSTIDQFHWESLVDVSVAADEVDRIRPHPDLIGRAMLLARVASPRQVAKVAVTSVDLRAAWSAGCARVIAIRSAVWSDHPIERWRYTDCIHQLSEVLPLVREQAR